MSRQSRFSFGTFFWPTVVVAVYVTLCFVEGLISGRHEPSGGVIEVSRIPDEFKRDLAIFSFVSLGGLFFGTWLIVLLIKRRNK